MGWLQRRAWHPPLVHNPGPFAGAAGVAVAAAGATALAVPAAAWWVYIRRPRRRPTPAPAAPSPPSAPQPPPATCGPATRQELPDLDSSTELGAALSSLGWSKAAADAAEDEVVPVCGAASSKEQWLQMTDEPSAAAPAPAIATIAGPWFFRASILSYENAVTGILRFGPTGGVTYIGDGFAMAGRGVGSWVVPRRKRLAFEVDMFFYTAQPSSYAPAPERYRGVAILPEGAAQSVSGQFFTTRGDQMLQAGKFHLTREEPPEWVAASLPQQPLTPPPRQRRVRVGAPNRAQAAVARAAAAVSDLQAAEPSLQVKDLWDTLTSVARTVALQSGDMILLNTPSLGPGGKPRPSVNVYKQVPRPCPPGVCVLPGWLTEEEERALIGATEAEQAATWAERKDGGREMEWHPRNHQPSLCQCGRSISGHGLPRQWQHRVASMLHRAGAFDSSLCPANTCSASLLPDDTQWSLGSGPDFLRRHAVLTLSGNAELSFCPTKGDEGDALLWNIENLGGGPQAGVAEAEPQYTVRLPPRSLVVWSGNAATAHRWKLTAARNGSRSAKRPVALVWRHRLHFCHCEPSDPDAPACADPRPPAGAGITVGVDDADLC